MFSFCQHAPLLFVFGFGTKGFVVVVVVVVVVVCVD
jgi:hypothetical protein